MYINNNLMKIITLISLITLSILSSFYIKNIEWLVTIFLLVVIPVICFLFYKKIYYCVLLFILNYKLGRIFLKSTDTFTNFLFNNKYIKIALVIYVFSRIGYFFYSMVKNYLAEEKKKLTNDKYEILQEALIKVFENKKIRNIFTYEFSIFAYFFLFWKNSKYNVESKYFTYMNKSGSITIYVAFIVIAIIEISVTHIILLKYFVFWVSIIFLYLNIYTFIFFIAHLKALYLRPIEINSDNLFVKNGLFANAKINISQIENISIFESDIDYKRKDFFKFALIKKMENHNIKILLNTEIKINIIYGFTKTSKEIYLFIDEKNDFYKLINDKLLEKPIQ